MTNLNTKSLFNFHNKTILITGSNGQIGSKISKLFLNLGSTVYGIDKNENNKIVHKKFNFIKADITNKNNIKKKLLNIIKINKKIDVIINTAAVSIFTKYDKRFNW